MRWLKNALIRAFLARFHPDMSEAAQPDALRVPELQRLLHARAARRARARRSAIRARSSRPVDGTVSQLGRLDGSWLVQAKGLAYTLESLLAEDAPWPELFRGGAFATLYLAPRNYHRVHMPLAGTLRAAWYVPGQLFSVNATTAAARPGSVRAQRARGVRVRRRARSSFALVLVGALFVGSMATVWHGEVTPRQPAAARASCRSMARRAA